MWILSQKRIGSSSNGRKYAPDIPVRGPFHNGQASRYYIHVEHPKQKQYGGKSNDNSYEHKSCNRDPSIQQHRGIREVCL